MLPHFLFIFPYCVKIYLIHVYLKLISFYIVVPDLASVIVALE